jgi:nucleotide-binding universal stress UspA family protein
VLGSSRRGPEGRVRIGTRTRQLLGQSGCALAVAPRGLADTPPQRLERIGMGYDGSAEARAALSLAAWLALSSGAKLHVRAVVDDRLPMVGWSERGRHTVLEMWDELLEGQVQSLREDAQRATVATGADAEVEAVPGAPPHELRDLSDHVDLLVIGSRRWGAAARVLLGSTGETVMHDAGCAVLVAPRPKARAKEPGRGRARGLGRGRAFGPGG